MSHAVNDNAQKHCRIRDILDNAHLTKKSNNSHQIAVVIFDFT